MRRKTVTLAATATRASDPVAQIGRDLATSWRHSRRIDEERPSIEDHGTRAHIERQEFHLADRRAALEAMGAEIQASSLEGAMVQIMLALEVADLMAGSAEDMRTISKLLYSVLAMIEQSAGVPREELGGEAYMPRDLDPYALVAKAAGGNIV